nr:terpene synthase family protein [uncultured Chitinophaga sp.]
MELSNTGIRYPFADAINLHAAWLENLTRHWLQVTYPSLPPDIKEKYYHTATGYITARFFPFASKDRLVPLGRSSLWGLAFDDYYEYATPEVYHHLARRLSAIICGEDNARTMENEFFHQMQIMASEFRTFMPEYWMQRFSSSMRRYIEAMAEESVYKQAMAFPTLEDYIAIRWRAVDVLQMVDGLEVATEEPLPDIVRHHPHIENIVYLTCRIISWANDYFSIGKEQGLDVMNLILVLKYNERLSLEEAKCRALEIHDADVTEYLACCQNLPDFGRYNAAVEKFLHYNHYMIAGHARWYTVDTKRYQPGGHPLHDFKRRPDRSGN